MLESFSVIFISIFLEALPFVILGTLISSLIEVFLPPDWIERRFSAQRWWNYLLAGLIGFVFPVCECAIVPIMRRLVKKGMPLSLGISFMLATPIVNPVVLMSTGYAFADGGLMALYRGMYGYVAAVIIGLIISAYDRKKVLLDVHIQTASCSCGHDHGHDEVCDHDHQEDCGCGHDHHDFSHGKASPSQVFGTVIKHTGNEVLDVGRFLIFGAFITALMQTVIPRSFFATLADRSIMAVLMMMLLGFVLSLCSEADAFIASSFAAQLPPAALLAFMVFGPMMDIKNLMMLLATFRKAFVIRLVAIITGVVFGLIALTMALGLL